MDGLPTPGPKERVITVDVEVDDDLRARVTNVGPEDDITMSALSLGNLITSVLRQLAETEDDDDDDDLGFQPEEGFS
jgi:hypothetical protein